MAGTEARGERNRPGSMRRETDGYIPEAERWWWRGGRWFTFACIYLVFGLGGLPFLSGEVGFVSCFLLIDI